MRHAQRETVKPDENFATTIGSHIVAFWTGLSLVSIIVGGFEALLFYNSGNPLQASGRT